jgi:hypothetical protein
MSGLLTSGLLKAGMELVDNLFTSDEERAKAKQRLVELEQQGELARISAAAGVVSAEAKSEHWLTATWRPIIMLLFGVIIANNYILAPYMGVLFGVEVALDIPPDMWDLLKLGLGGYVVGRSVEKGVKEYGKTKGGR